MTPDSENVTPSASVASNEQTIKENAHVAFDQADYQKRLDTAKACRKGWPGRSDTRY